MLTATNVVIHIPLPSAWDMDTNAVHVVAPITLWPYVSRDDGDNPADRLHAEVTTPPGEATENITDDTQAALPSDTTARAQAVALPIAPPTVQLIVHCPTNLTATIAGKHPIGTPRIVLRSSSLIASRQAPSLKVPSSQKACLMGR